VPGDTSADYFLVSTTAQPQGIYQHRLVLTSGTAGHVFTIRGLNQSAGVPGTTDTTFQTGSTTFPGAPTGARVIQWYGFGKQEQIYVRVTGTTTTTAPYSAVLETTPVTAVSMSGPMQPGDITIRPDAATDTAMDTDWWMYDGTLTAIPDFGHDDVDGTGATRNMTPGTYTLAVGRWQSGNNLGSPPDDTYRSGTVLDFPNAMVAGSATIVASGTMIASGNAGQVSGTSSTTLPFELMFYSISVVQPTEPTPPVCNLTLTPAAVGAGASTLITVTVFPGLNPDTSPHTVMADLSSIGDSAAAVFVEGPTNTFTYMATTSACLSTGNYPLTATVAEIASPNRSNTCTRSLAVTGALAGACCLPDTQTCEIMTQCACEAQGGSYQGDGSSCDRVPGEPINSADTFPIAITDNATFTTTITISNGQTVQDLDVCVGLTHTWVGDLIIDLSNSVQTVRLANRLGGTIALGGTYCFSDTATTAFPGAVDPAVPGYYQPFSPLSAFAGDPYDGTWTLTVSDNAGGDVGAITSFSIIPVEVRPACSFCPVCAADYNQDGGVDGADVEAFYGDWEEAAGCSDVNQDGGVDGGDVEFFFTVWEAGGCEG
jgi:subtilisin-like proprotein convertase family protein